LVEYTKQANKIYLSGHSKIGHDEDVKRYDSGLEAAIAAENIKAGLRFQPHPEHTVTARDGTRFQYTPDFVYERPHKLRGISVPVRFLEAKGVIKPHDFERLDAMEYTYDINGFIVTRPHAKYWRQHEFLSGTYLEGQSDSRVIDDYNPQPLEPPSESYHS